MKPIQRNFFVGLAIALIILLIYPALPPSAQTNPAVAQGHGGAVASVDRRATEIGIDILRSGGNAVDAAVATAAALGVTEPFLPQSRKSGDNAGWTRTGSCFGFGGDVS
jgi:gamma-glutamyltranspeptidase / glutathione hydrolase